VFTRWAGGLVGPAAARGAAGPGRGARGPRRRAGTLGDPGAGGGGRRRRAPGGAGAPFHSPQGRGRGQRARGPVAGGARACGSVRCGRAGGTFGAGGPSGARVSNSRGPAVPYAVGICNRGVRAPWRGPPGGPERERERERERESACQGQGQGLGVGARANARRGRATGGRGQSACGRAQAPAPPARGAARRDGHTARRWGGARAPPARRGPAAGGALEFVSAREPGRRAKQLSWGKNRGGPTGQRRRWGAGDAWGPWRAARASTMGGPIRPWARPRPAPARRRRRGAREGPGS
jgi:hypothetical protein